MSADGFGRELSCTTTLRTGVYVSGARLVGEAAFRRLTTPRGMLRGGEDEANYGMDLTSFIGASPRGISTLEGRIRNELLKDERIDKVTARVAKTLDGPATILRIEIDAETRDGPFTLVVQVDEISAQLLNIEG